MLRRIAANEEFGNVINKVVEREGQLLTYDEFMQNLGKKIDKLKSYVSQEKMGKMLKGQKYRNKVFQITL